MSGTVVLLLDGAADRGRNVDSSPNRDVVLFCHGAEPYGWPLRMLRLTASSSAGFIGMLTRSVQSGGLSIGQAPQPGLRIASPVWPPCQAPPSPILGPRRQPSPQGVSLHITADGQKMVVGLHGERFETSLVKVTGTGGAVMGMPALSVSQGQPLHELGEVTVAAGPKQEVEMIGHQAVGQQPHGVPGHCFSQDRSNAAKSPVVLKDGEPGVGPVERVINKSALGSAQRSSHGTQISRLPEAMSTTVPDTFSAFDTLSAFRPATSGYGS